MRLRDVDGVRFGLAALGLRSDKLLHIHALNLEARTFCGQSSSRGLLASVNTDHAVSVELIRVHKHVNLLLFWRHRGGVCC